MKISIYTLALFLLSCLWLTGSCTNSVTAQPLTITLDEAVNLALAHNPDIRINKYAMNAAEFRIATERSNRLPDLTLSSTVSRANEAPRIPVELDGATVLAREGTENSFVARLQMNQLIYDFGKTSHTIEAAEYAANVRQNTNEKQSRDIISDVKEEFYRVLIYRTLDSLYATVVPLNRRLSTISQERLNNGAALSPDVLQSQVEVQNSLSRHSQAASEKNKSLSRLIYLLGVKEKIVPVGSLPDLPSDRDFQRYIMPLYELALKNRKDLNALREQKKQQEAQAEAYDALTKPTILLQSDFSFFGANAFGNYSSLSSKGLKSYNFRVGIGFTYNFFDGFQSRARKREALTLGKLEEERAMQLETQIYTQIESLLQDLSNQRVVYEATKTLVDQTKENMTVVNNEYDNGSVPEMAKIQAHIPLVKAEAALLEARLTIIQTLIALERATDSSIRKIIY